MYIIGISAIDKDVSVTLFKNNKPIYSISEERLTRVKMQDGFPWKSFDELFRYNKLNPSQISYVAYPFFNEWVELYLGLKNGSCVLFNILVNNRINFSDKLKSIYFLSKALKDNFFCHRFCEKELINGLKFWKLEKKLKRFNHTLAHAASVFFSSGFDEAIIQISDWYGSGLSGGIFHGKGTEIKPIVHYKWPNSLGSFYARYTISLGFKPDRHEGKVMGLAAYGDPSIAFLDFLSEFELNENASFLQKNCLFHDTEKTIKGIEAKDIAAATQETFETILISSLIHARKDFPVSNICLAGGSMSNVKYSQKVSELDEVNKIFVFPAMPDSGTGYGAACLAIKELGKNPHHHLKNVYLSTVFSIQEIEDAIKKSGLYYSQVSNIEMVVSEFLLENKLIAVFNNAMEFGPRALGNRSILANPKNISNIEILNNKLHRNEFMPFAPSTTLELAKQYLPTFDVVEKSLRYMTISVKLDHYWKSLIPATIHIDGTARLHVVDKNENLEFHNIISSFYKKTGIPAVLNTSFNIHEEPIVYSPEDALKTFISAKLDYLAINPFIVSTNSISNL